MTNEEVRYYGYETDNALSPMERICAEAMRERIGKTVSEIMRYCIRCVDDERTMRLEVRRCDIDGNPVEDVDEYDYIQSIAEYQPSSEILYAIANYDDEYEGEDDLRLPDCTCQGIAELIADQFPEIDVTVKNNKTEAVSHCTAADYIDADDIEQWLRDQLDGMKAEVSFLRHLEDLDEDDLTKLIQSASTLLIERKQYDEHEAADEEMSSWIQNLVDNYGAEPVTEE